jgi:hypothetical protein
MMTPQERNTKIKELSAEIRKLKSECDHPVISNGYCKGCNKDFGWPCSKSPDKVCHYFSYQGHITLINGKKHQLPSSYDDNHESEDWCIFCGAPEERK